MSVANGDERTGGWIDFPPFLNPHDSRKQAKAHMTGTLAIVPLIV
jgi:hypothetical protein